MKAPPSRPPVSQPSLPPRSTTHAGHTPRLGAGGTREGRKEGLFSVVTDNRQPSQPTNCTRSTSALKRACDVGRRPPAPLCSAHGPNAVMGSIRTHAVPRLKYRGRCGKAPSRFYKRSNNPPNPNNPSQHSRCRPCRPLGLGVCLRSLGGLAAITLYMPCTHAFAKASIGRPRPRAHKIARRAYRRVRRSYRNPSQLSERDSVED